MIQTFSLPATVVLLIQSHLGISFCSFCEQHRQKPLIDYLYREITIHTSKADEMSVHII